jgi:hypothetical protein
VPVSFSFRHRTATRSVVGLLTYTCPIKPSALRFACAPFAGYFRELTSHPSSLATRHPFRQFPLGCNGI